MPHSKILSAVRDLTFSPLRWLIEKKKSFILKLSKASLFCSHQLYNNEHYPGFGLLHCPHLCGGITLKLYACVLRFVALVSCMQVDFALFCRVRFAIRVFEKLFLDAPCSELYWQAYFKKQLFCRVVIRLHLYLKRKSYLSWAQMPIKRGKKPTKNPTSEISLFQMLKGYVTHWET